MPRLNVIQFGARHRYAIPRIFNKLGMLALFITDSHSKSTLGVLASWLPRWLPFLQRQISHLLGRTIDGVPSSQIYARDSWLLLEFWLSKKYRGDFATKLRVRDQAWFFTNRNIHLTKGDILYTMNGENLSLQRYSRARGAKVMTDAFITPLNLRQTCEAKRAAGLTPTAQES